MFGLKEASEDKLKKMVEKGKWDKLNSFDIEEGVPMMDTSGENIFDGGEDSQSSQNIEVIKEGQVLLNIF